MQKGELKIYGEIFRWSKNSAEEFIARLNALDNRGFDVINIHVHCMGGEVLEGNAIFNAIKNCKTPVDIYVDGVAASMMTIIMLAARNIYMSQNAFLMIHAPSGCVYGTAKDMAKSAKLLKQMEANFKRVFAAKTGKTEMEIAQWMDGDNWFSADEAIAEKLINGIVDIVDEATLPLEVDEKQNYSVKAMYQRFTALQNPDNPKPINKSNDKKMNKQEVITRYGLTGVTAESSESDIYAAIDKKIADANAATLVAENKLKTEKETQVTAIVEAAIAEKKITEAEKVAFVAIGTTSGVATLQTALGAIKPFQTITGTLGGNNGGTPSPSAEPKTFAELQAMGDTVLMAWKKDRPQDYARLYKAEFGHDINS